jgi:DNA replication and repair protein RecF
VASRIGVVSFVPEDNAVIRGSPEVRRRALDRFAFGLSPAFAQIARRYEEALERRNRVLKAPHIDESLLDAYTTPLIDAGVELCVHRARAVARWGPVFAKEARAVGALDAGMRYVCALVDRDVGDDVDAAALRERFLDALVESSHREKQRRTTLAGPHLDDVTISKGDRRARHLASQGEARALVLALKLAQVRLTTEARGTGPLLLLDDVAGELDPGKQERLLRAIDEHEAQAFVTATHVELLPPLPQALVVDVVAGCATARSDVLTARR